MIFENLVKSYKHCLTMAIKLSSAFEVVIPEFVIATIQNLNLLYSISKTTEQANIYIEGTEGIRYKIYKRAYALGHVEYKSLIKQTMYNGSAWKKFQYWYFSKNIDSLLNKEKIDKTEFGEIHLNGSLCHKLCYNAQNIKMTSDEIEDSNIKDFQILFKCYLNQLKIHLTHDFIMQSMNYFKIFVFYQKKVIKLQIQMVYF